MEERDAHLLCEIGKRKLAVFSMAILFCSVVSTLAGITLSPDETARTVAGMNVVELLAFATILSVGGIVGIAGYVLRVLVTQISSDSAALSATAAALRENAAAVRELVDNALDAGALQAGGELRLGHGPWFCAWVSDQAMPSKWHGFRCAVYSRPKAIMPSHEGQL
jgi:outer membrane murein-binding lipoprotein Lpp